MNHIKKPEKEKSELVRTMMVVDVPIIVIIEILLVSKVLG